MNIKKYIAPFIALSLICCIIPVANALGSTAENTAEIPQIQNINSIEALDAYVVAVETANAQYGMTRNTTHNLATTITFSNYLTFEEFRSFAERYSLDIQQVQVRGMADDGTRITVFSLTGWGLSVTEANVKAEASANEFTVVGITDVYAYVNPNRLQEISDDSLTYLIDTSGNSNTSSSDQSENKNISDKPYFPKSLTWELENLGMMK